MERAVVIFKNPDNNREIKIDFVYDKKDSFLDYNITFSEDYSMTENLDFVGFLANMFLNCLQADVEENEDE